MENDLKIYSKKNYTLGIGNIERIEYKGNTISQFNEKEGRIDLSVLNHFVNKNADYYVTNSQTQRLMK